MEPSDGHLLVFVHIRKTAGKTLRQILYRQYGRKETLQVRNYFTHPELSQEIVRSLAVSPPPELRAAHGHMLFWPELPWGEDTRFCTLLRDPVERTISHYSWLRVRAKGAKSQRSLEERLADGSIHDNLQTRVLSGSMPPLRETSEEHLERAVANLDRFLVVGLTERFDESLVLLTRALDWRPMLYRRENVTPDRQAREEIPPETIELIQRHNALDLELYRRARERFEAEVARQGPDFPIQLAALQRANERAAGAPAPPGDSGDPRELAIERETELLLADAEREGLRPPAPPPARKTRPATLEERIARLEQAAERATVRRGRIENQIQALEERGDSAEAGRLALLREELTRAEERLSHYEQRAARLRRQLEQQPDGEPEPAAPG